MNSLWLVFGVLAAAAVAYRYYGAFLAAKVAVLDDRRATPAHRLRDDVDYHPTNKYVLFGVHFAAIAGPGPLVGPVLAAQWGYFPGFIWLVVGACLAGAVHDFVILWASVREDGMSLPKLARRTIGPVSGAIASVAMLFIVVVTLASVATVVVNALSGSPWGVFTIIVTIPAALLTGLWMYKIRPGHIAEASVVGVTIVLLGVFLGKPFAESGLGGGLTFSKQTLSIILPCYAAAASILPVWLLMCPRDYLSSYMKIGVIVVLAVGIFVAHPVLKMPATTPFLNGGGPVIHGPVWPFLCIVVMCGAISGFHSLVASGTTPKMVSKESDIRMLGYGAMVLESVVAVMALVAACSLEPGDYFAINADKAKLAAARERVPNWDLAPKELAALEQGTHEEKRTTEKGEVVGGLEGRVGGAVTLAVGMAKVFADLPGMKTMMSYWYHFVIMFEALFILTLLETGTRVARFVFQETLAGFGGEIVPEPELCAGAGQGAEIEPAGCGGAKPAAGGKNPLKRKVNWPVNVGMSLLVCFLWGYLLYRGDLETLWNMLGITNQLLAATALAVGTTYLLLHAPKRRYALLTAIPFAFLVTTTFTAGVMSVRNWLAEIDKLQAKVASQTMLTADMAKADKQLFMWWLVCVLAVIMLALVAVIVLDSLRRWWQIVATPVPRIELQTAGK
ncbi:MAG: carbon starvation protein A [Planctomycetota bacterium]